MTASTGRYTPAFSQEKDRGRCGVCFDWECVRGEREGTAFAGGIYQALTNLVVWWAWEVHMYEKQAMDLAADEPATERCRHGRRHLAPTRTGFTLIELSIVLVIIGLLVGGMLAGSEMVATATLRADMSQIGKFDTALLTFRTKFNCMPGDCARDLWPAAVRGNGNGVIEGFEMGSGTSTVQTGGEYISYEYSGAVDHLARAGLIDVSPFDAANFTLPFATTVPKLKGGGWFVLRRECRPPAADWSDCQATGGHTYRLGVSDGSDDIGPGSVGTNGPIYTPLQSFFIDSKLDDGLPLSGKVSLGYNASSGDAAAFLPITAALVGMTPGTGKECVQSFPSTNRYAMTLTTKACGLFIRSAY